MTNKTALPLAPPAPPGTANGAGTAPHTGAANFPVVVIGASAGGLEACVKLLGGLPDRSGICYIIVQHMDPRQGTMLVDLLRQHTVLPICEAAEDLSLAPDQLFVIPPASYLTVQNGRFHLSRTNAGRGSRMPLDFLLKSLAGVRSPPVICVILSGTGDDGALGLQAIKRNGGLVIAQDPQEAGYDGMPRNAILTGQVDRILTAAEIGPALSTLVRDWPPPGATGVVLEAAPREAASQLSAILEELRLHTGQDFSAYKTGTLQRRVARRIVLSGLAEGDFGGYVALLRQQPAACDALVNDLLINVTEFFRDPAVFALLKSRFIAELKANAGQDAPLRVWVVGCSTGEEAYSLAMIFHEAAAEGKYPPRLQVFASDADAEAIAFAREATYSQKAMANVSAERVNRFFVLDDGEYRIIPELRACIVFAVQDVLTDAPFSRIDLVSCRNLLIYLQPEAQAKVTSVLHFALRPGGLLLLGNTETTALAADKFESVARAEKFYRRIGPSRPTDLVLGLAPVTGGVPQPRSTPTGVKSRQTQLAEFCHRLVMENVVPAAVLINAARDCLQSFGNVARYLHVPTGPATQDILAMASPELAVKLRAALYQASQTGAYTRLLGGRTGAAPTRQLFDIAVIPAVEAGETLFLICFLDQLADAVPAESQSASSNQGVATLEHELNAARVELQGALHSLDLATEEYKAVNEEARSIQEEYQCANEELLTSKEELQSLNEELSALNSQLQETLDRQSVLRNDLENVLYSTDIATVFLDMTLKIRFFTPATRKLFNILTADIGRPLADLKVFSTDDMLLPDARRVIDTMEPMEREVKSDVGRWCQWRIMPYRTQANNVQGVVIMFTDVTELHAVADALQTATEAAKLANLAKSRFLASASHDLRQPLQSLVLLHQLLADTVTDDRAQMLLAKFDGTLGLMAGMLNTLLDINQLESGMVNPVKAPLAVEELLTTIRDQFDYQAAELGVTLRVLPSTAVIDTDHRLMEQILANLVSNALKYTTNGRVLVGCRHSGGKLAIEVWDTGIGIPAEELAKIFNEYYQLGNAARERSRGVGLGLAIVKRLATLLGHRLYVRSTPGKGSVFGIETDLSAERMHRPPRPETPLPERHQTVRQAETSLIMIVEDNGELRRLLEMLLYNSGYRTITAPNGITGISMVMHGDVRPDLILADFNLPDGMTGLQCIGRIRKHLQTQIPGIILTGDNSAATKRDVESMFCTLVQKPARIVEMKAIISGLLQRAHANQPVQSAKPGPLAAVDDLRTAYIIDDDAGIRETLSLVLEDAGWNVAGFASCASFLEHPRPAGTACLLVDAYLPDMNGIELIRHLRAQGDTSPAIMITGNSDVCIAVEAMKAGAADFIEKPVGRGELLAALDQALLLARNIDQAHETQRRAAAMVATLTPRQLEVMTMVLAGHPSKNIAADLDISQRTVENHRAAIMQRLGVKSIPALARLAAAAAIAGSTGG